MIFSAYSDVAIVVAEATVAYCSAFRRPIQVYSVPVLFKRIVRRLKDVCFLVV
ncbi:MAG: hypothetical protein QXK12_06815 [Candidatus Nezhaarchaeales archaeon]